MNVGRGAPDDIKLAVKRLVAHWFENREAAAVRSMREVPLAVDDLIRPYRVSPIG